MSTNQVNNQAVVVQQAAIRSTKYCTRLALFNEDGTPIVLGAETLLSGYTIGTAGSVSATDSISEAIGKLEARIAALETP